MFLDRILYKQTTEYDTVLIFSLKSKQKDLQEIEFHKNFRQLDDFGGLKKKLKIKS